jgi:protoporphyrinogen oxidase
VTWDRHYHVTLLSDVHLRRVLAELELEGELRWGITRTGCYSGGELHSVSNALELLRFPRLRLLDKVRLGATIAIAARLTDWRRLERIPVGDWLTRLSGARAFEQFWLPLLRSKLGDGWRETSAAFMWATIQRLYAARRTGLKREMFGYLPGGYARVFDRFARVLAAQGVRVRTGAAVTRIARVGQALEVALADGETRRFDAAVVTLAAPLAARICHGLAPDEVERLRGVRYQGIVCASLLLDAPLGGYYVTNITDPGLPFTGVIEMTALVPPSELGGHHLVYLPKYVPEGDPLLHAPDDEIRSSFLPALARMFPRFRADQVRTFRVSRIGHVCAVPALRYSERMPPIVTSVPGLYLLGSAHVVNSTLNVNEGIRLAERALGVMP